MGHIWAKQTPSLYVFFFQRRSRDNNVELFHSNVILFLCICTHNLRDDKGWISPRTVIGKTKHTSQRGLLSLTWQHNQHLPVIYFKPWKEFALLYKHQWNTRWAFTRKHDIFTRENNMSFSHVKISPLLWLHNKSHLLQEKTVVVKWLGISLVFIIIINRTLHGCLEIRNFSSHVEKIFHSFAALSREIFFNMWREILYLLAAM